MKVLVYKLNEDTEVARESQTETERPSEDSHAPRPKIGSRNQAAHEDIRRE